MRSLLMRRFSHEVLAPITSWGAALALLALLVFHAIQGGALKLERPSTVLTNKYWVQRGAVRHLLFLQDVEERVPRGAAIILVFSPATKPMDLKINVLQALSQFPDHSVIPAYDRLINPRTHPAGAYAAYFGGELHAPTYELIWRSGAGTLYRAKR
jgi:hypothetical protein